ncbi:unnamed protein product [Porites evermanni]|uniref:folate gamma-glutamyl hydrolase n=1 Tax=Porites evermanni TaxID=104178 RepID=A0ABN8M0U9_9CNID|nr:unnamed protein product [Porites evermanni]
MTAGIRAEFIFFLVFMINISLATHMNIFREQFDNEDDKETQRPIIGVLTQETDRNVTIFGRQYVAASYVKFIESAGGRMVPIFINATDEEVEKLFNHINGAIFPGGHRLLHRTNYTRVGKKIFDLAIKAFDKGDVFPIWAECLGLELVSMLVGKGNMQLGQLDTKVFSSVDAANISLPLIFPKDYSRATMWEDAPPHTVNYLRGNAVSYNNHKKAVTPKTFHKNKYLKDFFRVVATSKDRNGVEFIANMEGKRYPVFLFHWHPAKAQFEWRRDLDIKHTFDNILVGQYFANFFMRQARRSSHHFSNYNDERAALIYNYQTTYVEDYLPVIQAYFF